MRIDIKWNTNKYAMTAEFWKREDEDNSWFFELNARVIGTERQSTVTTVNGLMSEMLTAINAYDDEDGEEYNSRFDESTWEITQVQLHQLIALLTGWKSENTFINDALDADRAEGEWSSLSDGE